LGEGTGKGRRIAHALGASVQQRSWVVEAARSRWGVLDNRHRTTVGPPD
jgi:hypothetical protein